MKRIWNYLLVLLFVGVSSYGQNVGIGTATPARKLHIAGDMRLDNLVGSVSPYTNTTSLMIRLNNGDISGIAFSGDSSQVLRGNGTFGASPGIDHDWYKVGTTSFPTSINDDIYTQGQVGIGTSTPIANSRLHVAAPTYLIAVRGEASHYGVYGTASILNGAGVWGRAVGTNIDDTYGVIGSGGVNKCGVLGYIEGGSVWAVANSGGSFTGANAGAYGVATATNGAGVWGYGSVDTSIGVRGVGGVVRTGVIGYIDGGPAFLIVNSGGSFTGANAGVYGRATATDGDGVYGYGAVDTSVGVRGAGGVARTGVLGYINGGPAFFVANSGGSFTGANVGALGRATAATGGTGLYGYSASTTNGNGVYGRIGSATGFGVYAFNTNTSGTGLGARGNNAAFTYLIPGSGIAANGNNGVFGYARDVNGTGVIGVGDNNTNLNIFTGGSGGAFTGDFCGAAGYATSTSSAAYGIYGSYAGGSADGRGVYGWAAPADNWGYGVYGYAGYRGVYGVANNASSTGTGAGVYGLASGTTPYGVFANGGFGGTGAKYFVIDHPADPENKILRHACIESNEILNVYRGNVVLDNNGQAEVQLPDYFHLINKNFSYNLTPIGGPAQLYILQEIDQDGKFIIAGGKPGQKVSWYVYAERNDPYLQKYPESRQMVLEKDAKFKGKYFRPELYGQPAEKGIDYISPEEMKPKMQQLETRTIEDNELKSLEEQAQPIKVEKLEMNSVKVEKLEMNSVKVEKLEMNRDK